MGIRLALEWFLLWLSNDPPVWTLGNEKSLITWMSRELKLFQPFATKTAPTADNSLLRSAERVAIRVPIWFPYWDSKVM
jgi:hypothetical protein